MLAIAPPTRSPEPSARAQAEELKTEELKAEELKAQAHSTLNLNVLFHPHPHFPPPRVPHILQY